MRATAIRGDIRDLITDAADRLLARYGYQKMTMDDLAREVGVAKGTLYLHFAGKEEVTLSVVERIVSRVTRQLQAISESDRPPAARLRLMLIARVMIRFDSLSHYTQNLSDLLAALRPSLLARSERQYKEEARLLAEVLKDGQRAGVFARRDPQSTAYALVQATNSLLPSNLTTRELGERGDVEKQIARIADLLINGL
ncbi:MAG TPA: TetR/AcrR family transcriptional regulator [Pyrinomonadaceae bacterium]|nr:TetR/AcrR family transcriptional regulator [Pyrinomonadaceae bacterium]